MRVDHVVVGVALDAAPDVGGVGAGDPRLGHGEARTRAAVEQGIEELLALERRGELRQQFHVAGVGRRAVGGFLRQRRATHELAQRRVLEGAQAFAEVGVGKEQVPEAAFARFGLELLHDRWVEVRVTRRPDLVPIDGLRRIDPVADEVVETTLQLPGARAGFEVHHA